MRIKLPIFYVLLLGVLLFSTANINWSGDRTARRVLGSDAQGYYAYLPALFVYQDLSFSFADEIRDQYFTNDTEYDYRQYLEEGTVNKYYAGTALAQSPFFLLAHGLQHIRGGITDGYAPVYPQFISLASLFYLLLGIMAFYRICHYYEVDDRSFMLVVILMVFGTNLFHYAVVEPGMSHVYSFGCISLFLWQWLAWLQDKKSLRIIWMGGLLSLIVLIRPINVVILGALPFFLSGKDDAPEIIKRLFSSWKALAVGLILAGFIMGIQAWCYQEQTGNWWVYSYGEEGFNFSSPAITDFLFSYKKGYFLYTPMALLAFIVGVWTLAKSSSWKLWSWTVFFSLLMYLLASWWNWWYGGSFSSRVMVDFSAFWFLPMALWTARFGSKRSSWPIWTLSLLLLILCQIQTLQYRYLIIHWDMMDKASYWEQFLKLPG